ncbi:unnamed protein product [Rotaria sordida]|uniref:Uncharacterized protein n=1 Tax=Rotaria sordida TaxID=392033 RepID=A0A815HUU9_9BILA|nr:unnamed protein product [Rotaria sordida]CAF1605031.1 unnamed protein product [Rotaria sordida]
MAATKKSSDVTPSAASNNSLPALAKALCRGNACPNCGKCCDWYYDGNIDRDNERFHRGESSDICEYTRWHRRPNGPSVTCSYFYYDHLNASDIQHGFDICRCP